MGFLVSRGGGVGKLYRYVSPQRVWFLSHFGLKTGIDFDYYGLKSSMVFKETTGICLFNSKWIVEREKYRKYIIRAEFYLFLTSLLMRSLIIKLLRYKKGLKTGMDFRGQV